MGNEPEITRESEEYFDLINQKLSKETHTQHNEHKQYQHTKPSKNWKASLIKYINKQYDLGITWYQEVKDQILKTNFTSETKYLELFLWQKFEMRTKPRCLNYQNTSLSSSTSSTVDESLSEYELNKEKIKEYIKIFQTHLQNTDHPIAICINIFLNIFCREIKFHIEQIKLIKDINERKDHSKLVSEAITEQLVLFIFKLQKCFGYMYSSALAYKFYKKEKEDFITLFTSEFFSHKTLYDLIMELFTLTLENDIQAFTEHLHKLNEVDIQPGDVGVNINFRLDRYTEKAQVDFLLKNNIDLSDEKLIYLNTYHKREGYVAYESSIELLKKIVEYQTPFDKISLLASISTDVIDNVMKACKHLEDSLPKNYLSIDGDELILIFSFIVIKAEMPELLTHLFFIGNFITQDMKSSMIGYYYTTIEASVITVKGVDVELLRERNKMKKKVILPGVGKGGVPLVVDVRESKIKEKESGSGGEKKEKEDNEDNSKNDSKDDKGEEKEDVKDKEILRDDNNNSNIKDSVNTNEEDNDNNNSNIEIVNDTNNNNTQNTNQEETEQNINDTNNNNTQDNNQEENINTDTSTQQINQNENNNNNNDNSPPELEEPPQPNPL